VTVSLTVDKKAFKLGENVTGYLTLRNGSDHSIWIGENTARPDTIIERNGRLVWNSRTTGLNEIAVYTQHELKPGETTAGPLDWDQKTCPYHYEVGEPPGREQVAPGSLVVYWVYSWSLTEKGGGGGTSASNRVTFSIVR
jgi:hypothetical protein